VSASADDVAVTLRTRGTAAMSELTFAEQVQLTHVPPANTDGPIPGALLAAVSRAEADAMVTALAGDVDRDVVVTVEGSDVRMRSTVCGTIVGGTPVDYATEVVLTVAGGEVVAMEAHLDEESMTQHRLVLEAGGYERPGA
jgi:hypothetical protein